MPAIQSSTPMTFRDDRSLLLSGAHDGANLRAAAPIARLAPPVSTATPTLDLNQTLRQIEGLMVENRLMEADRALFLAMEQHGWHRAFTTIQERLDALHHRALERRVRILLDEAEILRLAGDLAGAFDKVETGLAMASGDRRLGGELESCRERLRLSLAEKGRPSAGAEPVAAASRVKTDDELEAETIGSLITAGELDSAAQRLEIAVARRGVDAQLKELYGRLAVERVERVAAMPGGIGESRKLMR